MKKRIVKIALSCIMLSCCCNTVMAEETAQYADDYVSFQYMKDVNCDINYSNIGNRRIYSCFTEMKTSDSNNVSAGIRIIDIESYEEGLGLESGTWKSNFFEEKIEDSYETKIIEGDYELEIKKEYKDGSRDVEFTRLIGYTDKDFAIVSYVSNEKYSEETELCKKIYKTAEVSEKYAENGCVASSETDFETGIIYRNVVLSEQGMNYAKAAIDILEKYLSFELDAETASEEIESIKNRSENYSETSDYVYDGYVDSELYVTSLSIDMGSDDAVTETLQDLKMLAHIYE